MPTLKGYKLTRRAVIAWVVAVLAVAWGVAGAWLWQEHQQTISTAERELVRLNLAASEQTHRLIALTDVFLDSLEQIISLSDGDMDTLTSPAVTERVTRLLNHSGGIVDVAVVNRSGQSIILPFSPKRPAVSVKDREHIQNAKVGQISIAAPIKGRTSGEWIIPVSRRIADPASPISVVMAAIHVPAQERVFNAIRNSKGGAIGLFRSDGILLARSPSLESSIGQSVADGRLFRERLPQASEGSYTAVSQLDGLERLATYRSLAPEGLVVLVSQTMSEVLAPWRRQLWLTMAVMALFSLAIIGTSVLLLHLLATLENSAKILDQRVTERTAELQHLMEARSSFLTSISHELRTPLNAIIGFSDALLSRQYGTMPERQTECVMAVHRSGYHLLALVNDLLDSASVDAGRLRLDETEFSLAEMVEEATAMVSPRAEAAGISLTTSTEPQEMTLLADRRRLMQAIINLTTNAIKYNHPGGRVTVTARIDPNSQGMISVTDNGIGMSAEDLETAMAPFGRVNAPSAPAVEGTGLGLPLTARIIELHGGRLGLDSCPGSGTTATITLPPARIRLHDTLAEAISA